MTTIRSSIVATADARGAFPRTSLIPPPSPSNGGPQESGRSFSAGAQPWGSAESPAFVLSRSFGVMILAGMSGVKGSPVRHFHVKGQCRRAWWR